MMVSDDHKLPRGRQTLPPERSPSISTPVMSRRRSSTRPVTRSRSTTSPASLTQVIQSGSGCPSHGLGAGRRSSKAPQRAGYCGTARFKKTLKDKKDARYARMLSSFAYSASGRALTFACLRQGVALLRVNPAYTTIIGRVKFALPPT